MKNRRKQRTAHTHGPLWAVIAVIAVIAVVGLGAFIGVSSVFNEWTKDLPDVRDSDAFNYSEKSIVYAADGGGAAHLVEYVLKLCPER